VDLASPAWDVVASGRLPALASLDIADYHRLSLTQGPEGGEGGGRLSRACEAVAGTLKRLRLAGRGPDDLPTSACHELGAAIGRLRRLRYLHLHFLRDGGSYHALRRGMAASGGCPELFEVEVTGLTSNIDWVTYEPSLIVPSVRNLRVCGQATEEEALLLACGLVQMGYKHRFDDDLWGLPFLRHSGPVRACMRAILQSGGRVA
jgi:hypothetical protein